MQQYMFYMLICLFARRQQQNSVNAYALHHHSFQLQNRLFDTYSHVSLEVNIHNILAICFLEIGMCFDTTKSCFEYLKKTELNFILYFLKVKH